jgi:hypothetical protein
VSLTVVYSPSGEKFEVTKANARDLVSHVGWSYNGVVAAGTPKPADVLKPEPKTAPIAKEVSESEQPGKSQEEIDDEAKRVLLKDGEVPAMSEVIKAAEPQRTQRLTVADFDDLEDKAAVADYIAKTFPDLKIDGRANRDKLIAQAIDEATA